MKALLDLLGMQKTTRGYAVGTRYGIYHYDNFWDALRASLTR